MTQTNWIPPALLGQKFLANHSYRIDLPGGYSVRFSGLACASSSALFHNLPIWDEKDRRFIPLSEARSYASR